jgi:hypothetical protein
MKKSNAQSASTESAPISDAELAAVLANSNWEEMERETQNVAAVIEVCEENRVNTAVTFVDKKMTAAHDGQKSALIPKLKESSKVARGSSHRRRRVHPAENKGAEAKV